MIACYRPTAATHSPNRPAQKQTSTQIGINRENAERNPPQVVTAALLALVQRAATST